MDVFDRVTRSRNMSAIRGTDTKPEVALRRALHALGYRFRLHRRDLPGRPDIVLPGRCIAIFVHGCYWHRHLSCRFATTPSTRTEFWFRKFEANVARDVRNQRELRELGWHVAKIWECQIRKNEAENTVRALSAWIEEPDGDFELPPPPNARREISPAAGFSDTQLG